MGLFDFMHVPLYVAAVLRHSLILYALLLHCHNFFCPFLPMPSSAFGSEMLTITKRSKEFMRKRLCERIREQLLSLPFTFYIPMLECVSVLHTAILPNHLRLSAPTAHAGKPKWLEDCANLIEKHTYEPCMCTFCTFGA